MKTMMFFTLLFASYQASAALCTSQQIAAKIQICATGDIVADCSDRLPDADEKYAEEQMILAFNAALPEAQSWLCDLQNIKFIKSGYDGMSEYYHDGSVQILAFNAAVILERQSLEFDSYYTSNFWTTLVHSGDSAMEWARRYRSELPTLRPGFELSSTPGTWPLLVYLTGHEFGHYLAGHSPWQSAVGTPCDMMACDNYAGSFVSLSFANPVGGFVFGTPPTLNNPSEQFLQQALVDDSSKIGLLEDRFIQLQSSEFATAFAPQNVEEDFCETMALYLTYKAGGGFSNAYESGRDDRPLAAL